VKVILRVKGPDVKLQDAGSGKVEAGALPLRSVHAWYLAPLFAGTAVCSGTLISVGLASTPMPRARLVLPLSACAAVVTLPFWLGGPAVWRLNQSAGRAYLEPCAKELRALLDEIRSEQGGRQAMTASHSYPSTLSGISSPQRLPQTITMSISMDVVPMPYTQTPASLE